MTKRTDQEWAKILFSYKSGTITADDFAARHGVHRNRVYVLAKKYGFKFKPQQRGGAFATRDRPSVEPKEILLQRFDALMVPGPKPTGRYVC